MAEEDEDTLDAAQYVTMSGAKSSPLLPADNNNNTGEVLAAETKGAEGKQNLQGWFYGGHFDNFLHGEEDDLVGI